jgi:hypothetical protein
MPGRIIYRASTSGGIQRLELDSRALVPEHTSAVTPSLEKPPNITKLMRGPNNAPYPNTDGVKSQSVILLKVKRKNFNDACFSRYPWGGDPFRCLSQLEAAKIMQLVADKTQSESGHFQVAPGRALKFGGSRCCSNPTGL